MNTMNFLIGFLNSSLMEDSIVEYNKFSERLNSFVLWPDVSQTKEDLAKCGFYYTDRYDLVQCHACGLAIHAWKKDDNPWEQHILHSKDCIFLKSILGEKTVEFMFNNLIKKEKSYIHLDNNSLLSVEKQINLATNVGMDVTTNEDGSVYIDPVKGLNIPTSILTLTDENQIILINKLRKMIKDCTVGQELKSLVNLYNNMIKNNLTNLINKNNNIRYQLQKTNINNENNINGNNINDTTNDNVRNIIDQDINSNNDNININTSINNTEDLNNLNINNNVNNNYESNMDDEISYENDLTNMEYNTLHSNNNNVPNHTTTPMVSITTNSSNFTTRSSTRHTEEIRNEIDPNNDVEYNNSSLMFRDDTNPHIDPEETSRAYIDEIFNEVDLDIQMQDDEQTHNIKILNTIMNTFVYSTVTLKKHKSTSTSDLPTLDDDKIQLNAVEENLCKICFLRSKQVVLLPCKHYVLCNECFYSTTTSDGLCPFCRTEITSTINVFNI